MIDTSLVIKDAMLNAGVTRSELARRLGKSKSHITQMLGPNDNLTLRTLSSIMTALGVSTTLCVACVESPTYSWRLRICWQTGEWEEISKERWV